MEVSSEDMVLLLITDSLWIEDGKMLVMLNDIFYYATADCEEISWDEIPELARLVRLYGFGGRIYWASKKRNMEVPRIPIHGDMLDCVAKLEGLREAYNERSS